MSDSEDLFLESDSDGGGDGDDDATIELENAFHESKCSWRRALLVWLGLHGVRSFVLLFCFTHSLSLFLLTRCPALFEGARSLYG